jgi:hypothetical protein
MPHLKKLKYAWLLLFPACSLLFGRILSKEVRPQEEITDDLPISESLNVLGTADSLLRNPEEYASLFDSDGTVIRFRPLSFRTAGRSILMKVQVEQIYEGTLNKQEIEIVQDCSISDLNSDVLSLTCNSGCQKLLEIGAEYIGDIKGNLLSSVYTFTTADFSCWKISDAYREEPASLEMEISSSIYDPVLYQFDTSELKEFLQQIYPDEEPQEVVSRLNDAQQASYNRAMVLAES